MKYENIVYRISNYATFDLERCLHELGQKGFKLVNTNLAKNRYGCIVMYLFLTKEINEEGDE